MSVMSIENKKTTTLDFRVVLENDEYFELYKTNPHFNTCVTLLTRNDFTGEQVIEIISKLCLHIDDLNKLAAQLITGERG